MSPFRFGPDSRQLHGVYFPPSGASLRQTAILLCAPFAHEATRSHRLYRVLAERLARAGFAVLRFDYSGSGDSDGDFAEATLTQWRADIVRAHAELLERSGLREAAWVGLRLGATLAWETIALGLARPVRLVAWEPLVDGARYLDELMAAHMVFLRLDFGLGWAAVRQRIAATLPINDQAFGFPLTPVLRAEFAALDLITQDAPKVPVTVLASIVEPGLETLQARFPELDWTWLQSSSPWNTDAAMNSSIVPGDLLDAVHAALAELR